MTQTRKPIRALGLCSGGLDSLLAGLVLRNQGLDVTWISFETPFFTAEKARKASAQTGIPLIVRNITPVYLDMLRDPHCGYGRNMNPCMDCHTLMFRLAGEIMTTDGYGFLFSGEVLGQRPMSQTASSLRYVEKHSGYAGYILRPLSAKRLPETLPEQNSWVDRQELYGFSGRSRKPQMELARKFGLTDYPSPAGGCLLTDKGFSKRLKDLFDHQGECREHQLELLKYGRHFRLGPETKLIVGRDKNDNDQIFKAYDKTADILIKMKTLPGPTVLLSGKPTQALLFLAATICASYSRGANEMPVDVAVTTPEGRRHLQVIGVPVNKFAHLLI